MQRVSDRQLSIMDFDRLAEIKDVETRNAVLEEIGTKNFENKLTSAINDQRILESKQKVLEELTRRNIKDIAECKVAGPLRRFVCAVTPETCVSTLDSVLQPGVEYYYTHNYKAQFYIYKTHTAPKTAEEIEKEKIEEERNARGRQLREVAERAFSLRFNFIKNFSKRDVKKYLYDIIEFTLRDNWDVRNFHSYRADQVLKILGVRESVGQKTYQMIALKVAESPEYALLVHAYAQFDDNERRTCHNHNNQFAQNGDLINLYSMLSRLGYELSDEEQQMIDGTSPLFAPRATE